MGCGSRGGRGGAVPGGREIKLLFLRGGGIHDWKTCTSVLVPIFERTGDFEVTLTENLDDLKAENINKFNLVLFYTTGLNFAPGEQGKEQEKASATSSATAAAGPGMRLRQQLLPRLRCLLGAGRRHLRRPRRRKVHRLRHRQGAPHHEGDGRFREIQDETYSHRYHKNMAIRSLLRMDKGNERQAMAWVQDYGKGHVFYTGLGHGKEAWVNPAFQRLVIRGCYWAVGRDPEDLPA